jgi:hypothetical protein
MDSLAERKPTARVTVNFLITELSKTLFDALTMEFIRKVVTRRMNLIDA